MPVNLSDESRSALEVELEFEMLTNRLYMMFQLAFAVHRHPCKAMPASQIICTVPQCGKEFTSLTSYRRHHLQAHKQCPDSANFTPQFLDNRPTNRGKLIFNMATTWKLTKITELKALAGVETNNVLQGRLSNHNSTMEPEPPQLPYQAPIQSELPRHPTTHPDRSTENLLAGIDHDVESPSRHDNSSTQNKHPLFDRSKYDRIDDAGVTRYVHRTAGRILRKETTNWQQLLASRQQEHSGAPWYPFANEAQWKLGYWLSTCKSSQGKIDKFLEMEGVSTYH